MPTNSILNELQLLGFSDYEVRTYTALLKESPATAYQISKTANIPRANTYSVLESLTHKNAVIKVSLNPGRFMPVPPSTLFKKIAEDTYARCTYLEEELTKLDATDSTEAVWTVEGQVKVENKITEIIAQSKRHIWIKAHKNVLEPFVPELKKAAKRGISLLIILFGADHDPFNIKGEVVVLPHEGNGVRMGDADNYFTITTDFKMALTSSFTDGPLAAFTKYRPVVTMAESLIRHDLYMAEIFLKFGKQIEEEFGPHLYKLRSRYFSADQMVKFSQTINALNSIKKPTSQKPRKQLNKQKLNPEKVKQ